MKILVLDTSTEACSVAVLCNNIIFHEGQLAPRQHTRLILPMIESVLAQAKCPLSALNAIGFSAGPGSFTGIRIAAGVVQGLALALDIPVIPVSTLAILAQQAYRQYGAEKILPALDAKMNQVYWGAYHIVDGIAEAMIDDQVVDPDKATIPEGITWIGIGSGWASYLPQLELRLQNKLLDIHLNDLPDARDIIPIAKSQFVKKKFLPAEEALPLYLRNNIVDNV
jgi:tRNA threonylcarbamoyladenosine biosynthesis protein TsaB